MVQINRQTSKIENLNKIQMNTDILGRYPYKIKIDRQIKNHVILGF